MYKTIMEIKCRKKVHWMSTMRDLTFNWIKNEKLYNDFEKIKKKIWEKDE
jgi:hypothetical protein